MTPPINSVSPERLDELARWAASEEAECLQDDMPVSAGYYADIIKLIADRRAANTPVDGVPKEPSASFQDAEERLCNCGAAGSGFGHAAFCDWLSSEWKRWGDAYETAASPALPSQVVGVKELDWKEDEPGWWCAQPAAMIGGLGYEVRVTDSGKVRARCGRDDWAAFDGTLAEAKAAAQADFNARIQSCLTSPAAEPVGWMVKRPLRAGGDHLYLPFLHTREEMERYAKANPHEVLQPLYTHPAPSASRGVTDEMVLRSCQSEYPALFRHGLTPPEGSGLNSRKQMETIIERHRSALTAALLAALPERDV